MIATIALGIVSGILAFSPLGLGLKASRKVTRTSNFGHASILLLSVLASFAVLIIPVVICITWARDMVLPFVLAEALALSASAITFGIYKSVKK